MGETAQELPVTARVDPTGYRRHAVTISAPEAVRWSGGMPSIDTLLHDERGYPRLVELGASPGREWAEYPDTPLRMTRREWDDLLGVNYNDTGPVIVHPRFSLSYGPLWCDDWDYCAVARVRTRTGKVRRFGPHWRAGLAEEKLLRFLVAERCVEILPERGEG